MKHHSQSTPICPKCGYDQSGEILTWQSRCPLDGRCPECGLGFAWGDVFDPSRTELRWYVEHAHSKWAMLKRTGGTLRRLALPWVYWRAVGVEPEVRLRALLLWAVLMATGLHMLVSIPIGFGLWHGSSAWYGSIGPVYGSGLKGVLVPMINAVGSPFVDAFIYRPTGGIRVIWGMSAGGEMRDTILVTLPFIGMTLFWMLVMLVAPVTRKQAKIRAPHVIRATLISSLTIVLAFELTRGAYVLDVLSSRSAFAGWFWQRVLTESLIPIMMIWVLLFWASAIRAGWKIRVSWLLIILGSIASLLGGLAFYFVTVVYLDLI